MKTKLFGLFIFVIMGVLIPLHAQTFDKLWGDVNTMQKKGLPQSAIKITDDIFNKALKEKNSPQMLKAYISRMNLEQRVDPDSFYVNLKDMQQWAETTVVPMDKAILNSLIANIYSNYLNRNSWTIGRLTPITGEIPEDMKTWSGNIFVQKIFHYLKLSLQDKEKIQKISSKTYVPIVIEGATSAYFHHDMFDLLSRRAIDILQDIPHNIVSFYPQSDLRAKTGFLSDKEFIQEKIVPASDYDCNAEIMQIYQSLLSYYKNADYKDAIILTNLARYNYVKQNATDIEKEKTNKRNSMYIYPQYITALNELIEQYPNHEVCAEVYGDKGNVYRFGGLLVDAYRIYEEGAKRYPRYARIDMLEDAMKLITFPNLLANWEGSVYPGMDFDLKLRYKNTRGVTVKLYKINDDVKAVDLKQAINEKNFIKNHTRLVNSRYVNLNETKDFQETDTIVKVKAPAAEGRFVLSMVSDKNTDYNNAQLLSVTKLRPIIRYFSDTEVEFVVVNNESGQPVKGVTVELYRESKGDILKATGLTTDSLGRALFKKVDNDVAYYTLQEGTDFGNGIQRISRILDFVDKDKEQTIIKLLTDRGLYRPGQTVFVKGVIYKCLPDTAHVVVNAENTLSLYDANGQMVAEKKVRSNDFGSFTAEFVLPSVTLNGAFRLNCGNSSVSLLVEEYKRPTFEVKFSPVKGAFTIGDTLAVKGNVQTLFGVPVQGATASYTVTRSSLLWWRSFQARTEIIQSGELSLNDEGGFDINTVLKPEEESSIQDKYYSYSIQAKVTNNAGETVVGEVTVAAGTKSLLLSAELNDNICKERLSDFQISAVNLDGTPVDITGNYSLWQLPDSTCVLKGAFTANEKMKLAQFSTLPAGEYRLNYSAKDNRGREVTGDKRFVLYSLNASSLPIKSPNWFVQVDKTFASGKPAYVLFGSSEKDVFALVDICYDNKSYQTKILRLTDEVEKIEIPYPQEENVKAVTLQVTFVKHGKGYINNAQIELPLPDKKLAVKWDVFRDKLKPGEKEQWKLTIKKANGSPADAEFLATMYDASLDKISPFTWGSLVDYYRKFWWLYRTIGNIERRYAFVYFQDVTLKHPQLVYDRLVDVNTNMLYGFTRGGGLARNELTIKGVGKKKEFTPSAMDMATAEVGNVIFESEVISVKEKVEVRSNFAETVFFYPQLRTNEKGEVTFDFTMPQSLTRWKFMGLANTKDMYTDMLEAYTITSKEFMIVPNMPRFVRVGDKSSIAASIMNLSDKGVDGKVTFELFDPVTEKVVLSEEKSFSVEAKGTSGVTFLFTADGNYSLLGCRMVAEGGTFSDGEQRLLPVLSDKIQVTETKVIQVRGKETRKFGLDDLFNSQSKTATDRRLTVEFTGNPAWYAIQALPTLSNPVNDNTISWAAAYYANSLASYIMNSQPRIKAVFDSWKIQHGTKETLWSNLQKNQDLKNILLQESPWVMQATTEAEQKERLGMLFDLNTIRGNNSLAINKLSDLQLNDGSWSWYNGMRGSRYVTQFVLGSFVKLSMLTNETLSEDVRNMKNRAFSYLHKQVLNEYNNTMERIKKGSKEEGISDDVLDYLYLCSLTSEPIPAASKQAYSYYLKKTQESLAGQTLRQKAMSAIILAGADKVTAAADFMNSIKEYSVTTDEMGMYFPTVTNAYSWSNYAIPTQTLIIQAMDLVGKNAEDIENMKLWLLKQKQTQAWDSPISTVDAVYALLNKGINLFETQGNVKIMLGKEVLETYSSAKDAVPGLGYIQKTFTDREIEPSMKTLTIKKRDAGVAWGAVYAQYLENINKVKSVGGALTIEKKLYVEKIINNKTELQPITKTTQLRIGDKVVVRLAISTDRDMDFVQLKDERAACFEPQDVLSGYRWGEGVGYYVSVKEASTEFFFDNLRKGTYVLTHSFYVSRNGEYAGGVATLQSAYAPEFVARSASVGVEVK